MNKRTGRPMLPRHDFTPSMIRRLKLSHREIGERIGATRSRVFGWAHGVGSPTLEQIETLKTLWEEQKNDRTKASRS